MWNVPKDKTITDDQIKSFTEKLVGLSPAYENFNKMSPSVQKTYTRRYCANKSDEAQQRDFEKIVDRLNKNLKPM